MKSPELKTEIRVSRVPGQFLLAERSNRAVLLAEHSLCRRVSFTHEVPAMISFLWSRAPIGRVLRHPRAMSATALLVCLVAWVQAGSANATTIFGASANWPTTSITLPTLHSITFGSFSPGVILPGTLLDGANTLSDLTVDLSGFNQTAINHPGPVTINDLVLVNGGQRATFHLTNAVLTQETNSPIGLGFVTAKALLDTNPADTTAALGAELAQFATSPGNFLLSYQFLNVTSNGITGTVTETFDPLFGQLPPVAQFSLSVPEPTTAILGSIAAVFLAGAVWRRRKPRQ
jgi:hypothetical protein